MVRSFSSFVVAVSISFGLCTSAAHAGGSGGGHGGGSKSMGSKPMVARSMASKPMISKPMISNSLSGSAARSLGSVSSLPKSGQLSKSLNSSSLNSSISGLNLGANGANIGKGIKKSDVKISDLSKTSGILTKNDINKVTKIPGLGVGNSGGSGNDKGPDKAGGKNDKAGGKGNKSNKDCKPHCNWWNGCYWGYGIPFPFAYPTIYTQGVCYDTFCQTAPLVVTTPLVQTAASPARPIDLEIVEIRQLDAGDAANGPAFRVILKNSGGVSVAEPFDVTLVASIGQQITGEMPHASVALNALAAGQAATVDMRMPAEVMALGRNVDGASVPFAFLTAIVDGHGRVEEVNRENNVLMLSRANIAMAN